MVLDVETWLFWITEIQSKRQERKRRTTANPVYSGAVFEPEVPRSFKTKAHISRNLKIPVNGGVVGSSQSSGWCLCLTVFLFLFQRKKSAVSYLNSPLHQGARKRGPYKVLTRGSQTCQNWQKQPRDIRQGSYERVESGALQNYSAGKEMCQVY